ncbi:hypothetical protein KI387_042610, partial [Taxus chinensis]
FYWSMTLLSWISAITRVKQRCSKLQKKVIRKSLRNYCLSPLRSTTGGHLMANPLYTLLYVTDTK